MTIVSTNPIAGTTILADWGEDVVTDLTNLDQAIEAHEADHPHLVARARRLTSSSGTTSEVGVLRLDDIPIKAGRAYRIYTSQLTPDTDTANDVVTVRIRHTTNGATPTTSSTILPCSNANVRLPDIANGESVVISTIYAPAVDETLSLLLCVARTAGSGTVLIFANGGYGIEIFVEDVGEDPGDTGVDI